MGILWDFQKAVYARLNADPNFDNVGVGDWPDADTAFPHITIGEDNTNGDRDKSGDGRILNSEFHIWSEYRGWKEGKVIADDILTALFTSLDLSSSGYCQVGPGLQLQPMVFLTEDDGKMRHIMLPLRFLIKEVT